MTLGAALIRTLEAAGDQATLEVDGEILTASALLALARARGAEIARRGPAVDGTIWVRTQRGGAYWIDLVACWATNYAVVPIDARMDERARAVIRELAPPSLILDADGIHTPDRVPSSAPREVALGSIAPGDIRNLASILLTSGSTGASKGALLSASSLLGNARATLARLDLRQGDRLATAIPFHFTSAICHFLAAILAGATLITTERRMLPVELASFVRDTGATCFGGAPLQVRWLTESAEAGTVLRWMMSSGDRLDPAIVRRAAELMPETGIYTVYGLTEVGGRLCVLSPDEQQANPGTVGQPIDGYSIVARDADGRALASGTEGELWVSGPLLFAGYVGEHPGTSVTPQGFRTGDVGVVQPNGMVAISGRADDVFKVAGQKVSGLRIADALRALPGIVDAAVIDEENPAIGAVPVAAVVLEDRHVLNLGTFLGALSSALPKNHLPHRIVALNEIPRTGSGKIARAQLRALLRETRSVSPLEQ